MKSFRESLLEKLTVADGQDKWIEDFLKSDAPQFKGKTKEEIIKMAVAAFNAAKDEMKEEVAIANSVAGGGVDLTPHRKKKKTQKESFRLFDVPSEVFRKFETGRNKFERWSRFLDVTQENQKAIYDYAKKNPKRTVVLRDEVTGALRAIRRKSSNQL
jgi:hypothetical protein